MFFLHFLYLMDIFSRFLRFYNMFQKNVALVQAFLAQKFQETNYLKISFLKHNTK